MNCIRFDWNKQFFFFLIVFYFGCFPIDLKAQLSPPCQLDFGINLGGLADFGTELPFVDLMKNARTWYTKDVGNPNDPFNSGHAAHLTYRPDGYPTHVPQEIPESEYPQRVVTIWAITDGWPPGQYTILWEGTGTFQFLGTHENLIQTDPQRIVFDFPNPIDGLFELTIVTSDINDPIHNIRLLMPGAESSYLSQPFNPQFIDQLITFDKVRFMDWGQTNNWGQTDGADWNQPELFDWSERSQMDHYTWAYEKGVPYEMMVKLMNDYDLDGWICVPHRASDDYLSQMAIYFRDHLDPQRHLTVEYSNEIWNWIFGQTHWLNEYGCIQNGIAWPNGIAPYIQNCLDHFTTAFSGQLHRITRVVGAFTGWPDITNTIANEMVPGSYDAIAATFYFGLTEAGDAALDALGTNATSDDVAYFARQGMAESILYIQQHKTDIADPLGIPIVFYEGGQHLTPYPFGVIPSYEQALLDIQRDTAMYNLYNEWFDLLRPLQEGENPLQLMHFSFISHRSAQYGSWGLLESMNQDFNLIPAPKYAALIDNLPPGDCNAPLSIRPDHYEVQSESCSVHLEWQSALLENCQLIVERRSNNSNFHPIASISCSTSFNNNSKYTYVDHPPTNGIFYYRILVETPNGEREPLGGIQSVDLACDKNIGFMIHPTITNQSFHLTALEDFFGQNKMMLFDFSGQLVYERTLPFLAEGEGVAIDVGHLVRGVYSVHVLGEQGDLRGGWRLVKVE